MSSIRAEIVSVLGKSPRRHGAIVACLLAGLNVFLVAAAPTLPANPDAGKNGPGKNAVPIPIGVTGTTTLTIGLPTGPSPDAKKNQYSLDIYYLDANGSYRAADNTQLVQTVMVPNIVATPANPSAAQATAASKAKAQAIVDAVNAAGINGVMAKLGGTMAGAMFPQMVNGRIVLMPCQLQQVEFTGVVQRLIPIENPNPGGRNVLVGDAVYRTSGNRVTGEIGNGKLPFTSGGSMVPVNFEGIDQGLNVASASGVDASGNQSLVGFGFVDTSTATPTYYVENMPLEPGMTDSDVLGTLASMFTQDYSADGYTATYCVSNDSLMIDQPLGPDDMLWDSDSDTQLDFDPEFLDIVPEPASLAALAFSVLLLRRR